METLHSVGAALFEYGAPDRMQSTRGGVLHGAPGARQGAAKGKSSRDAILLLAGLTPKP